MVHLVKVVAYVTFVFCELQEKGEIGAPGEAVFGPPGVPGGQGPDGRSVSTNFIHLKKLVFEGAFR